MSSDLVSDSVSALTSSTLASSTLASSTLASGFTALESSLLFSFSEFLSAKPSCIAGVIFSKILVIDFDASSLDGITYSTSLGSELVSTIANIGIFNF